MNKLLMLAAVVAVMMGACTSQQGGSASGKAEADSTAVAGPDSVSYLDAIDAYLVDSLGSHYSQGDMCVPLTMLIDVDESNADSVKVWGSFWVFNYKLSGDTLKTVSGGSHPGMFLVSKTSDGYKVVSFDAVGDGSRYEPTGKRIFGDKYDAFSKLISDEKKREQQRVEELAAYVKQHGIKATLVQDADWPAVKLPE
jgi:hypothetical protein